MPIYVNYKDDKANRNGKNNDGSIVVVNGTGDLVPFGYAQYTKKYKSAGPFDIKKVIFNEPATIVLWMDGTKTVVKCENEVFDPEKGLAMAISKKALGNTGHYYETFKKHIGVQDNE